MVIQTLGVDFSLQAIFERTNLFSQSTRILVDAMQATGMKRLIAVTGLGAGDSRGHGMRSEPPLGEDLPHDAPSLHLGLQCHRRMGRAG